MAARWDGDDRGEGVAEAGQLVSGASELVAAFREPGWVAEQPELHLLPHVTAWSEQDRRLALIGAETDAEGAYVLNFEWREPGGSIGAIRAAVFALLGSFAEPATYIRQHRVADAAGGGNSRLQFEVGTGELAADSRYKPHGHVVMINVAGLP